MEAVAAITLVCEIFQIIELGRDTLGVARSIYEHGSPPDAQRREQAGVMEGISGNIHSILTAPGEKDPSTGRPRKQQPFEKELVDAATRCKKVSHDLNEEMSFLSQESSKGNLAKTLKLTTKTAWRKRRINRLEADLAVVEQKMQSGLMARVWASSDVMSQDLEAMDSRLRHFIEQYDKGRKATDELVLREHHQTRVQVTSESRTTRRHVTDEATRTQEQTRLAIRQSEQRLSDQRTSDNEQAYSQLQRDRLLRSLKYPAMNERRNGVKPHHAKTLKWIFQERSAVDRSNGASSVLSHVEEESETRSSTAHSTGQDSDNTPDENIVEDHGSQALPGVALREQTWDNFLDWLRSTDTMYWISGKPGSGKSTLAQFILEQPDTEKALKVWKEEVLIVSHFFWRPGNAMQKNIKGMLCSIVHQLVSHDPVACQAVVRGADGKDSHTDWSVEQLLRIVEKLVQESTRSIFLFLDGIDEIVPEYDMTKLIAILYDFSSTSNTKICIASRPEPLIERRLGNNPQLRLQDLNREDLLGYTKDHLGKAITRSISFLDPAKRPEEKYHEILEEVVEKAQGVFLWLNLAVGSLVRGLDLDDTLEDLRARIESLPPELETLYEDMWARMNQSEPQYRQEAALYLKLVIESVRTPPMCADPILNVFQMVLASNPTIALQLITRDGQQQDTTESMLLGLCERTKRGVLARCAGLLEITPRQRDNIQEFTPQQPGRMSRLYPWVISHYHIGFIHRTAMDFLLETSTGLHILGHEKTSWVTLALHIQQASMTTCDLFGYVSAIGMNLWALDSMRHHHWLSYIAARGETAEEKETWFRSVKLCQDLCRHARIKCATSRRIAGGLQGIEFAQWFAGTINRYTPWVHEYLMQEIRARLPDTDTASRTTLLSQIFASRVLNDTAVDENSRLLFLDLCRAVLHMWANAAQNPSDLGGVTPLNTHNRGQIICARSARLPFTAMVDSMSTQLMFATDKAKTASRQLVESWVPLIQELVNDSNDGILRRTVPISLRPYNPSSDEWDDNSADQLGASEIWLRIRGARVIHFFLTFMAGNLDNVDNAFADKLREAYHNAADEDTEEVVEFMRRSPDLGVGFSQSFNVSRADSEALLDTIFEIYTNPLSMAPREKLMAQVRDTARASAVGHGPYRRRLLEMGYAEPVVWIDEHGEGCTLTARELDDRRLWDSRASRFERYKDGLIAIMSHARTEEGLAAKIGRHRECCPEWTRVMLDMPLDEVRDADPYDWYDTTQRLI